MDRSIHSAAAGLQSKGAKGAQRDGAMGSISGTPTWALDGGHMGSGYIHIMHSHLGLGKGTARQLATDINDYGVYPPKGWRHASGYACGRRDVRTSYIRSTYSSRRQRHFWLEGMGVLDFIVSDWLLNACK